MDHVPLRADISEQSPFTSEHSGDESARCLLKHLRSDLGSSFVIIMGAVMLLVLWHGSILVSFKSFWLQLFTFHFMHYINAKKCIVMHKKSL